MDLEDIIGNSKKIDEYISFKVTECTRKLQGKVNHLEKQISNPKEQKGTQTSSASVKRYQYTSGPKELCGASDRFRCNIYAKSFAHTCEPLGDPQQLFICSKWEPDPDATIPPKFNAHVSHFLRELKPKFHAR
jgi:hypothetical protein